MERKWARIIRVRVGKQHHHFHYCAACDDQWPHAGDGVDCTMHWAAICPKCAAVPELRRTA